MSPKIVTPVTRGDAMFIGSRIDEPESKKPEALE